MKHLILGLILFCLSSVAFSQQTEERRSWEAKMILGTSAFLDEEIPFDHFLIGGSARRYLTNRLSIEPQLLYMRGPRSDRDLTVIGNVAYDVLSDEKFALYLVCGGGLLRHTELFGAETFSSEGWTVNGGVGARIPVSRRLFVAPEFRVGWEPLLTAQVAIGYSF